MEIITIIGLALQFIGAATVMLRIVAPLTKTTIDNKVLEILTKILKIVSLNMEDKKLNINIK